MNGIKTLLDVEIETEQPFMKEYINIMKEYAFGMLLRKGKWNEEIMIVARFYSRADCDLHELS